MPKYERCGYDRLPVYTVTELAEMYEKEGMSPTEAKEKALHVVGQINLLTYREHRFWKQESNN